MSYPVRAEGLVNMNHSISIFIFRALCFPWWEILYKGLPVGCCISSLTLSMPWPNLFWLRDWDWPLLCGYLCIYNFITPKHFQFNPCELLPPVNLCELVALTHFYLPVYAAGTSSSVKGQYATNVAVWALLLTNVHWKGINLCVLPSAIGKL